MVLFMRLETTSPTTDFCREAFSFCVVSAMAYFFSVFCAASSCSRRIVFTRAMSLRRPRIFLRLSVCPMLSWNFSLNSWSARSRSWCLSSASVKLRIFSAFIISLCHSKPLQRRAIYSLVCRFPLHERSAQGQLMRGQPHGLLCIGHAHAFHFEQDLARAYNRYPVIGRPLAFSHTSFGRLLGDGFIREEADPNF